MTAKFFAILTNQGAAKLANATALGTKLDLTQLAVGDGGGTLPTPDPAQTSLKGERRRAAINMLSVDPANPNQIMAEQVIPENEGGWWIREIGLFDKDDTLIAVANCPETYKPQLQEGSGRTQTIRMVLIVSSTEAVTLKIDPAVVLATRAYVDNAITAHAQSRNHPDASTTAKGFVQLSSSTNSTSEALAATPKALKAVSDASLKLSKNLADLTDRATARQSLGLKAAALYDVGNGSGQLMANGEFGLGGFLLEKQGWQGNGYNFSAETGQPCTTLFSYESSNVTGATKPPAWLETAGWGMGFRWFRAAEAKNQTVDFLFSRNGRMGYRFYYNGKDYEFYTTGNKPTALEINALPSAGGNLTGIVKTSAEIQSTSQNNYRIVSGGYGSFWRQDATGLYLLLTEENDPYGSYSPLRPIRLDIKTGDLTFGESVTVAKTLRAAQVWDNNLRVYSPNNKPTANDVGALERSDFPVGIPQPWPTITAPTGWLKCNGAAFDKARYPLLAAAYPSGILPDMRGEFVRGWDDGRGIDSGRSILGAQSDELRSHRHLKLNVDTSGVAYGLGAGNFSNQQTGGFYANTSIGFDSGTPGIGTGPTGGAETRPRNIAFNYIVRAA